ncbi:flagellar hook-basal body complex protein FliE [Endozoicomonas sp. NE40]|uniref:Flagellar hook-basal body complex protein FliE n=2 Tax=Endozoicomonas lisbonensis TaxID=3120522 RepID=A0ABV2SBM5_9GAMM
MQPIHNFAGVVQQRITLPGATDVQDTRIMPNETGRIQSDSKVQFSQVLDGALQHVSELGHEADQMRTDYELGLSSDLVGTMIASEKASLSFQAVVQVRNRVVSAYETVFNMPV